MFKVIRKVVEFQKEMLSLKAQRTKLASEIQDGRKKTLLTQIDWFDSILLLEVDIVNALVEQKDQVNPNLLNIEKSVRRLRTKIERQFRLADLHPISPKRVDDEPNGVHVVETKSELNLPNGTVLEILRVGYRWQTQVLRPAEVISVKN